MTDEQCLAIIAAVLTSGFRARDYELLGGGDLIVDAAYLLAKAEVYGPAALAEALADVETERRSNEEEEAELKLARVEAEGKA